MALARLLCFLLIAEGSASDCTDVSCNAPAFDEGATVVNLLQTEIGLAPVHNVNPRRPIAQAQDGKKAVSKKEPETTTLDPTGMSLNGEGDLDAFLAALITNVIFGGVLIVAFSVLRRRYPIVYAHNSQISVAPYLEEFPDSSPDDTKHTYFGWYGLSRGTKLQDVIDTVGLDQAMLLEFCNMSMKIMAIIGIPMFFIMGPMHWAFGGNRAGKDYLSYLSFGNVQDGNWMYWIHAFIVWAVVIVVQSQVYRAQNAFLQYRFNWLKRMPDEHANTLLVEGIPEDCRSEKKLMAFFKSMLPGVEVASTCIIKDTDVLEGYAAELAAVKNHLQHAEAHLKTTRERLEVREGGMLGAKVDAIEHYKKEIKAIESEINKERERVKKDSVAEVEGINLSRGFVTFKKRVHAAVALQLEMTPNSAEWVMSVPPEPSSLIWSGLKQDPTKEAGKEVLGYVLVGGLFFIYMPLVIGITNVANMIDMGPLQSVWQGLAPTMGLQIMVAFLPTFLILIFQLCFPLKANVLSQHKIQIWYFGFQVVFVILATAVGTNVRQFCETLAEDPLSAPAVFAQSMPFATHFYMNFLALQWVTHLTNLCRTANLGKFLGWSKIFDEDEAKEKSEPEDQDYYGLGSRSARFTINLCIGVVFGTLSPPINLLCLVNFAVCRIVYGYLCVYAEKKKPDLGGVFWVTMLKHVFVGNIIYVILMIGVLMERSDSWGPSAIAGPSLIYVIWSMRRFDGAFKWEKLPHSELQGDNNVKKRPMEGKYEQPEMIEGK